MNFITFKNVIILSRYSDPNYGVTGSLIYLKIFGYRFPLFISKYKNNNTNMYITELRYWQGNGLGNAAIKTIIPRMIYNTIKNSEEYKAYILRGSKERENKTLKGIIELNSKEPHEKIPSFSDVYMCEIFIAILFMITIISFIVR